MVETPNNEINFFAETNFRGQRRRFGIRERDRSKHVYIIGKTGMGKSTLLENMTIQDIQAGRGVAVVDPHGEYAERMLDFVPQSRINDVIYLNPADLDFPIAFNVMENVDEDKRHLLSAGLLGVFKKIFGPDVWSARMEYLLANAILGLLEVPGSTLLSVNRMFGEKEFRKRVVTQIKDPVIRGFWENEFAKYPEQYMREAVAAIQNKIGQFSGNPLIRNIVGQTTSSIDLRSVMDDEKIFIVNISKGRIGEENSRLLGAMIVTKLYLTAMSRVDMPEPERKDFYLYVDEFQNFATESFANILSEARKYHLNLTVAHQYVFQMEEMVQHAIFGNVGTMIVFRVGGEDAELLEKEFMPEFVIQDLVNLGFKNIYTKLMIDGVTSRPFSAETLAPMALPAESFRETIIRASRERYGTPRAAVEEKIARFTGGLSAGEEPQPLGESIAAIAGARIEAIRTEAGGRGQRAEKKPAQTDRRMYEAKCAVDGKAILVPFEPDTRRPVYCEEHMGLIKFRAKAKDFDTREGAGASKGLSRAAPRGQTEGAADGGPFRRESSRSAAQPISLDSLKPDSPRDQNARAPAPRPTSSGRKDVHLAELRKALNESLRSPGQESAARASGQSGKPQAEKLRPEPKTHSLQPGEVVRFE